MFQSRGAGQIGVCCITGESIATACPSPVLEILRQKGFEVVYFVDLVRGYCVQHLKKLDGNVESLESTTKERLELVRRYRVQHLKGYEGKLGSSQQVQ